jgi:hypothetical protein
MKPVRRNLTATKLRLRPGGLLFLRPPWLRQMRWTADDTLVVRFDSGRLTLYRQPSESEWRIHRLRTRISPNYAALPCGAGLSPRTWAAFLGQRLPKPMIDTGSAHITPAGGNVFSDLGFSSDEAAVLREESKRRIDEAMTRQQTM